MSEKQTEVRKRLVLDLEGEFSYALGQRDAWNAQVRRLVNLYEAERGEETRDSSETDEESK